MNILKRAFLTILLAAAPVALAWAEPVAFVTNVKGDVTLDGGMTVKMIYEE